MKFCYIHVNLTKSWVFPISLNIWLHLSKVTFSIFSHSSDWESLRIHRVGHDWASELNCKGCPDLLRRDCISSSSLTRWWANFRELNLGYTSHSWKSLQLTYDPEQMLETSGSNWWGEVADRDIDYFLLRYHIKTSYLK